MNKQKIPATLVSGFLGSGKTTLLSNVLKQPAGRRVAVVVSVPADSSIDSDILRGTDIDAVDNVCRLPLGNRIYELSNGCLCCAVQDDFHHMMKELAHRKADIDHVMIETPGTELPISFLRRLSSEDLSSQFTIDSVITVADGPALADGRYTTASGLASRSIDTDLQFLYQAQLDIADVVLISKTDLVFPAMRRKLQDKLKGLLTHDPDIISMQHGLVNPDLLFDRACNTEQRLEIDKIDIDEQQVENGFDSVIIKLGKVDSDLLVSRLQMLIREQSVYRTKGFAELPNKMMRQVVQGVGSRIDRSYDRRWGADEERSTHLQIIGRQLDPERLMATLRMAEV
ncbi:GTP-binding protein [Leucothrix pacifica]|uniref:Cobalamin biosynthesis protein CobW n=1 Tax=Leucothrix pacifica TaxID=1247513 RepID=A0A317CQJ1_9GAMM|nr:GTP-binding protein [Leucothrix pacifica]PWQ99793.1 cobalamin biosynthesis protein CobW [Leucothrix pacifica]